MDPLAAAVGAVNTIAIREGRTTGHNTDVTVSATRCYRFCPP
jgi:shikimate 5-dehydrogenase